MKTFAFITVFLLLLNNKNKAQEYFPFVQESKAWSEVTILQSFLDTNYKSLWTTSYKLEGDTTIGNGKVYKQFFTCDSDPSISSWDVSIYAYREDSGKVYRMDWIFPDEEELIYDFSLGQGDSILFDFFGTPTYAYVNHVDTVLVNGSYRKRIHFDNPPDIWVEGLGSMFRPFMPLGFYYIHPNSYGLLCVSDTTGSIFVNPVYGKCYIDTVMTNIAISNPASQLIHISNNPMHGFSVINIENSPERFYQYALYGSNGLPVRKGKIIESTFTILRGNLSSGVYILKLLGKNDVVSKKLMID